MLIEFHRQVDDGPAFKRHQRAAGIIDFNRYGPGKASGLDGDAFGGGDDPDPGGVGCEIFKRLDLACSDTYCLFPQKKRIKERLSIVESGAAPSKIHEELFADLFTGKMASPAGVVRFNLFGWQFSINTSSGFGWVVLLLTAALGGLLLNFTPCVLPLIPIKIISLSHASENRQRCFLLDWSCPWGFLLSGSAWAS